MWPSMRLQRITSAPGLTAQSLPKSRGRSWSMSREESVPASSFKWSLCPRTARNLLPRSVGDSRDGEARISSHTEKTPPLPRSALAVTLPCAITTSFLPRRFEANSENPQPHRSHDSFPDLGGVWMFETSHQSLRPHQ